MGIPLDFDPELSSAVERALHRERDGYQLLGPPTERHGSVEWVARRDEGEVQRFVIFAATPLTPRPDGSSPWLLELWAAAQTMVRFDRTLVRKRRGRLDRILEDFLESWSSNTFDTAQAFDETQLRWPYPHGELE
jgi:hypothetical protein